MIVDKIFAETLRTLKKYYSTGKDKSFNQSTI